LEFAECVYVHHSLESKTPAQGIGQRQNKPHCSERNIRGSVDQKAVCGVSVELISFQAVGINAFLMGVFDTIDLITDPLCDAYPFHAIGGHHTELRLESVKQCAVERRLFGIVNF